MFRRSLAEKRTFKRFIAALRRIHWVVHCKAPFAGPEQVLRYLSRYTHRVAISNRRLVAADNTSIAFRCKDYRINGPGRWKTMRLHPHEFIRRFLMHVLPKGFHRIRHYGLFANANRAENIATARALLHIVPPADPQKQPDITPDARPTVLSQIKVGTKRASPPVANSSETSPQPPWMMSVECRSIGERAVLPVALSRAIDEPRVDLLQPFPGKAETGHRLWPHVVHQDVAEQRAGAISPPLRAASNRAPRNACCD